MKDFDKALFKTLECRGKGITDREFLIQLSDWIFDLSGNVNVTMRLKIIAERIKCGGVSGSSFQLVDGRRLASVISSEGSLGRKHNDDERNDLIRYMLLAAEIQRDADVKFLMRQ